MTHVALRSIPVLLFVSIAGAAAMAEVKVYSSNPPGGAPADFFIQSSVNCPPVQTLGDRTGSATIADDGSGTVTLNALISTQDVTFDFPNLEDPFGPGAFAFTNTASTLSVAPGQTGVGSTAAGAGFVVWGVLSGWSATGGAFCLSSPVTLCEEGSQIHGVTVPSQIGSLTYDLGTWAFDAEGDYEASPYIFNTFVGGLANSQVTLRGTFVGASLPALPLVGFGALAIGLLTLAARGAVRKN